MRPLLIPSSYPPNPGGVETVVAHLAAELRLAGHAPIVVTNRRPKSLPRSEVLDSIPVQRRALRVPQRSVRGVGGYLLNARRTRAQVVTIAREHGCDLVNLHCVSSNAEYAIAVAEQLAVPLVVSLHGELSGDAGGVYEHDPRLRRVWNALIDRADHVTAPSRHTLEEAALFRDGPLPPSTVIANGVDIGLFAAPGTESERSSDPFVLAAGRLVRVKGFHVLVDAWSELPEALAGTALVIAGEGPEHAALTEQVAASPARSRITLVGRLDHSELARLMRSAAMVAVPSLREALGLTAMEAMAAGTPVVASSVGGLAELVDATTGWPVEPDNPSALAAAIARALADTAGRHTRALAARDAVSALTWPACARNFLDVYDGVTTGRG